MAVRSRAVGLITKAVEDVAALVAEDRYDAAIATTRLSEIATEPKTVVRGDELKARLEALT